MASRGWWQQNYGWSWMVVGSRGEIMPFMLEKRMYKELQIDFYFLQE